MTSRRIRFEYPDGTDPMWTPLAPEFACAANSVSLMMPAIEPFFVRSIAAAVGDLEPELAAVTRTYLAQESQHHAQHLHFNRLLLDRYGGLRTLEPAIRQVYRRLERSRSLRFRLAFAAGSEIMAYSAARWAADHRRELFSEADEVASSLFLWHLAEEVEHKSVAHDVYQAVAVKPDPNRARATYVAATALALALVVVFVVAGTSVMLFHERRLHHPLAWIRLVRWALVFAFELLTNLTLSVFPSFHPTNLVDPTWYTVWLNEFDEDSQTLPVWNRPVRSAAQ